MQFASFGRNDTVSDHRLVHTARLDLAAVTEADVPRLHELSADPRVWQHFPSGRHTSVAMTARQVATFTQGWRDNGLGYWTATLRATSEFVGVGGCALCDHTFWNVYYRLHPDAHGNGYAGELVKAAVSAAAVVGADLPVVAYMVEHNMASRSVAERLGLQLVWRGPDRLNPDPTAQRLIFADRMLTPDQLNVVIAR
jgi:RimJ/RimL family protein N-acetyltransferase